MKRWFTFISFTFAVALVGNPSPSASCPTQACSGNGICVWGAVTAGVCEGVSFSGGACYCPPTIELDSNCTLSFMGVPYASESNGLLHTNYDRPDGTCAEIPCGTCYEYETDRACYDLYRCLNASGNTICPPTQPKSCDYRFDHTEYRSGWWRLGGQCCINVG